MYAYVTVSNLKESVEFYEFSKNQVVRLLYSYICMHVAVGIVPFLNDHSAHKNTEKI